VPALTALAIDDADSRFARNEAIAFHVADAIAERPGCWIAALNLVQSIPFAVQPQACVRLAPDALAEPLRTSPAIYPISRSAPARYAIVRAEILPIWQSIGREHVRAYGGPASEVGRCREHECRTTKPHRHAMPARLSEGTFVKPELISEIGLPSLPPGQGCHELV
jgi:hypothetical protein